MARYGKILSNGPTPRWIWINDIIRLNERKFTMKLTHLRAGVSLLSLCLLADVCLAAKAPAKTNEAKQPPAAEAAKPVDYSKLPALEQPLILVDGFSINSQDYLNFLQNNPTIMSRAANTETGKTEAIRELTRTYLLRKAMYDQKLLNKDDKEPPTPNMIAAAYEKLAKQHFPAPPAPDEKTAYAYYQAHQDNYGIPGNYRLNQILIKTPTNPDPAVLKAAEERAQAALKRLTAGEAFSAVASELTESTIGKLTGGDIGYVDPAEQPWLKESLLKMKVGDRVGPIKSPEGVVVLELTDIRPALISPYGNVRDKVIKDYRDEQQKKVRDAYVLELAKGVKIEVAAPSIQSLFPNGVLP
jgi:parvulin-like peptidyl-prolyl isomerase